MKNKLSFAEIAKIEAIRSQASATREVAHKLSAINEIEREKLEQQREEFEEEKRTNGRADIALDDYMKLVEENKMLKEKTARLQDTIMKIVRPLMNYSEGNFRIPEEVIRKIINDEFDAEVYVVRDNFVIEAKIGVIYKVDMRDLMGR